MTYFILVFLSFLQSVIGFSLMTSSVMKFKEPMKQRILMGTMVMIMGISLLLLLLYTQGRDAVDGFVIFVILAIQLSWFLICANDRFYVSVFSFLTFGNIYISISYISDSLTNDFSGTAFVLARIVVRTILYLLILPFLYKIVRKRFRMLVDTLDKEWRVATLVPLMFLIVQSMVLYYPNPYWYWNDETWSRVIIITLYLLFLAVYYLLSTQASAIVDKYALEKQQLLMSQQEKLWEAELIRQKTTSMLAAQQRHDLHHHNTVIMSLVQSSDYENLKAYVSSFDVSLNTQFSKSYSANPIINSLINFYASRADEENVRTTFNINVPEHIGVNNIDLTCVLGNALENALEGCLRLSEDQEKEINVTLKYFDQRLRIKIENSCREDILFEGELPETQKVSGGTGTKSILYTVERYDGIAGFSMSEGKFTTQIVLNTNPSEL